MRRSSAGTSSTVGELRAAGDRVLIRRVHNRGRLITHVHETMGVTDRVLQLGEVVGLGNGRIVDSLKRDGLEVKDLVVYPTPRVFDHFRHTFEDGTIDVLVVPADWVVAIVKNWFLADDPSMREYGDTYA
jgi:hypothetical protein